MCVEIKARRVPLSDSLLDYTECRWRVSLERLGHVVDSVVARYHRLGAGSRAVTSRCRAVVHLVSGELLVLDGVDGDVYRAIDRVTERAKGVLGRLLGRDRRDLGKQRCWRPCACGIPLGWRCDVGPKTGLGHRAKRGIRSQRHRTDRGRDGVEPYPGRTRFHLAGRQRNRSWCHSRRLHGPASGNQQLRPCRGVRADLHDDGGVSLGWRKDDQSWNAPGVRPERRLRHQRRWRRVRGSCERYSLRGGRR